MRALIGCRPFVRSAGGPRPLVRGLPARFYPQAPDQPPLEAAADRFSQSRNSRSGAVIALTVARMKITLASDEEILLEDSPGGLTIEAPNTDMHYSPYHMLASALAACTFSVLHSWAAHAKLHAHHLKLRVSWTFAENPHRVGAIDMMIEWPDLPDERRNAALRAARLCPVHHTLTGGAVVAIEVSA